MAERGLVDYGPLGCVIPRRARTVRPRHPETRRSCWLASPVLEDGIVHADEQEALEALCLIGACSPVLPCLATGDPVKSTPQLRAKRSAETQQHSKGSSSTGGAGVASRLAGSTRKSGKPVQQQDRSAALAQMSVLGTPWAALFSPQQQQPSRSWATPWTFHCWWRMSIRQRSR